jgi:hypothetical protein
MPATPLRRLIAMVLVALALLGGGCSRSAAKPAAPVPLAVSAPGGRLQELPPPGAVQQLAERLGERDPHVDVLAPADNALLPAGPWALKLRLSDWPLAAAEDLGLGPHLVVQVDEEQPLLISQPDQLSAIPMAELSPGSHRITVYAARPWGEAVKSPGASRQIRLHRVAANPAQLPAPGTPQLIAASPSSLSSSEPVLIDWLLLDAPLQHLRDGDDSWRLRVTVNGDSFLVDRQVPLWLKGFRSGSNAVQLELLDGRGDPLNPPFNSLVQEVVINGTARAAWQRPTLSNAELELLSGESPRAPATRDGGFEAIQPEVAEPGIELPEPAPTQPATPQPSISEPSIPQASIPQPADLLPSKPQPSELRPSELRPSDPQPAKPQPASSEAADPAEPAIAAPEASPAAPNSPEQAPPQAPQEQAAEPEVPAPASLSPDPEPDPQPQRPEAARIAPSTNLTGSARELVNADGSLLKPRASGPLARLREKLGG